MKTRWAVGFAVVIAASASASSFTGELSAGPGFGTYREGRSSPELQVPSTVGINTLGFSASLGVGVRFSEVSLGLGATFMMLPSATQAYPPAPGGGVFTPRTGDFIGGLGGVTAALWLGDLRLSALGGYGGGGSIGLGGTGPGFGVGAGYFFHFGSVAVGLEVRGTFLFLSSTNPDTGSASGTWSAVWVSPVIVL